MAKIQHKRPSWNEYFMKLAQLVATRSTCLRRGVGAVIVKDKRVLSTGYNGVPKGVTHCPEAGCLREKLGIPSGQRQEICRGLHAEQNAFLQAASFGVCIKDSVLYCTHQPCVTCAKMIINAGVNEVIFGGDYPDKLAVAMLKEAKVKLTRFKC
jgi:dCMP deaminase